MRAWAPPIAAVAALALALSFSLPLFSLLLEGMGHSGTAIGANATAAAVAMVAVAPFMPALLARIGIVPLLVGSTVSLALLIALAALWHNIWYWTVLRFLFGAVNTAMFFASEYWVVAAAPAALRGRIVGIYGLVLSASFIIGPQLLGAIGTHSPLTFATPVVICLLAVLPILWGRNHAPASNPGEGHVRTGLLVYFVRDPTVLWGVVVFGMIEFGAMGLFTVWGVRSGLAEASALTVLSAIAVGSMLFQLPIGWAADRHDRRILLMLAGAIAGICPLAMIWIGDVYWVLNALAIVWGGCAVGLYSLALAELGSRYSGQALAEGNAAVVLAYGLGALLAPAGFGAAMDVIPPDGLLWLAGATAVAYVCLALWRRIVARTRS